MRWWDDEMMRRWDDEMKRWEEKSTQCNSKLVKQKETKWKGKLKKSSNRVWIKMKIHVLFTVHQIMDWWSQDILHCFASFSASHSFFFFNQNDTHKFSFLFILSLSLSLSLSRSLVRYLHSIFRHNIFRFPSLSFFLSLSLYIMNCYNKVAKMVCNLDQLAETKLILNWADAYLDQANWLAPK